MTNRTLLSRRWMPCTLGVGLISLGAIPGSELRPDTERAASFVRHAAGMEKAGAGPAPRAPVRFPTGGKYGKQPSVLEAVPGLEKAVTLSETKIPLGELVQLVADRTGVSLMTAREVADEPVAVVVRDFPARELLEQLADLLDYRWSRRRPTTDDGPQPETQQPGPDTAPLRPDVQRLTPRFEIWQDLSGKQREEALRRTALAEVERRFQEELWRCTQVAALSQTQIEDLLGAWKQRQRELAQLAPEQRSAVLDPSVEHEERLRAEVAQRLRSPLCRALAGLIGRLSPQRWGLLRERGRLSFSTDPHLGELSLPAEIGRVFRSLPPSLYPPGTRLLFADPGVEERIRQREDAMQAEWEAATGYRVTIRFEGNPVTTGGTILLDADITPLGGRVPTTSYRSVGGANPPLLLRVDPGRSPSWRAARTPEQQAALANDPTAGAKQSFGRDATDRVPHGGPVGRRPTSFRELLPELARAYGVHLISDAYTNAAPISAAPSLPAEPTPLFALLDRSIGHTHNWDHGGKLVRLRSRTWFLERPREVPLRIVRHCRQRLKTAEALPLDTSIDLAARLSDGQLANLPHAFREVDLPRSAYRDAHAIYPARHVLRLCAALAPAQRRALGQRRVLPMAPMTLAQRGLFRIALEEGSRRRATPLDLSQWSAGSLSMMCRRPVSARETRRPPGSAGMAAVMEAEFHLRCGSDADEVTFRLAVSPP